jgi:uncharacterized protein (UPF0210 family)
MHRRAFLRSSAALLSGALLGKPSDGAKPKIRAITAFVTIERPRYQDEIQATLQMLRQAKRMAGGSGYDVESLRIVTQPFPEYARGLATDDAVRFFREYDAFAIRESFDPNIGPAMLHDDDDPAHAELLAQILSSTKTLGATVITGGATGVYWKCVAAAAKLVKFVEEHSPASAGNFKFATTAMLEPYGPFYPGAYHLGTGKRFAVAMESANVVDRVFAETSGDAPRAAERLTEALGEHTTAVEKIARQVEREMGWTYMGLDPTPAPLKDVSIGAAIEKFTGAKFGSSGTMTAAAVITRAVQSQPVKRIGYSGLMVPVLEDTLLAQRWTEATYNIDSLLAYSAVCGTGLDTVPLPGDISEQQIRRIMGDVATLACKWKKPLSARLLPIKGKKAGDRTAFDDPFLVNAVIQPAP